MRLRMRPDAYPAAVDGGAAILTATGWVRFTGASVARWIDALAPHLDGRPTLAELTARLAPAQREQVERLVAALLDSGVVREVGEYLPAELTGAERREYAPEITFLGNALDSAAAAFARYRGQRALVLGDGELLAALARATVASGVGRVRIVAVGADGGAAAAGTALRDPAQLVACDRLPALSGAAAAELVSGADLVLHGFDGRDQDRAALLDRACARAGVRLLHVAVTGDEAWLTPLTGHPGRGGRELPEPWSALRRRLAPPPFPPGGGGLGEQVAAVLANQAAQRAFTAVTGAGAGPEADRPWRVDLRTLVSRRHAFVPHPYAAPAAPASEAGFRDRLAALRQGPRMTEEEFSRLATECADDRLGVIVLGEHGWAQRPLHVTGATVRMPVRMPLPGAGRGWAVTASGFTHQAARCGAALQGLAAAAALLVDPRRLVDGDAGPLDGDAVPLDGDRDDPEMLLRSLRHDPGRAHTWGVPLDDPGVARLVPAEAAFPLLATGPLPAMPPAGVAGGYDWQEAVTRGLLAHCRVLTEVEVSGGATNRPVDLAGAVLDPTGDRCRELLTRLGELPEAYDITGSLGVPTFAFVLGGAAVACGTGMTATAALSGGLRQAVQAVQARVHNQPGYAPPPGPALEGPAPAARQRGARPSPVRESPPLAISTVAARLRAAGRMPVVVPLDHDPGLVRVAPYLVHVVLLDESRP